MDCKVRFISEVVIRATETWSPRCSLYMTCGALHVSHDGKVFCNSDLELPFREQCKLNTEFLKVPSCAICVGLQCYNC